MSSIDSKTTLALTSQNNSSRFGLTLIEILVALTMTLILLGAMMSAFNWASDGMQKRRADMEMANRARSVEDQLRSDLASLTIDPYVYTGTTDPNGYLEIVERPRRDFTELGTIDSYLGDIDDILAMTIRSRDGVLFRGRTVGGGIIESPLAEVVWFTSYVAQPGSAATTLIPTAVGSVPIESNVRLHRRQLLIRPDLGVLAPALADINAVNAFLAGIDISSRVIPSTTTPGQFAVVANDLTDLARRENRFAHFQLPANFPNEFFVPYINGRAHNNNEDIMLTDVIGFDLQVYSPDSLVALDTGAGLAVDAGDPGYAAASGAFATTATGAFVDLGHGTGNSFSAIAPVFHGHIGHCTSRGNLADLGFLDAIV